MSTTEMNPILKGLKETFTTIPPVTRCLLAIILFVFIGQNFFIPDSWVCFGGFWQSHRNSNGSKNPSEIYKETVVVPPISWKEAVISFFLSPFSHLGFLHILMNSLVLMLEGGRLEKSIERRRTAAAAASSHYTGGGYGGTNAPSSSSGATIVNGVIQQRSSPASTSGGGASSSSSSTSSSYFSLPSASATFLALTILLILTTNTSMALMHMLPFYQLNLVNTCVLGFSAVIFGYFSYGCYTAPPGATMLFCSVSLPAPAFPWVMLMFTYLLMPSASFSGHFFGVVWGIVFARVGFMNSAMRSIGLVFGRGAVVCPPFMTCGATSRGSSPAVFNYFSNPNTPADDTAAMEEGNAGVATGRVLGGGANPNVFQMGRAAHPDVSGYGPSTAPATDASAAAHASPPHHGGAAAPHNNIVVGIPIHQQQPQGAAGENFRPFQGEGRKLGGGGP